MPRGDPVLVDMDDQIEAQFARGAIAEGDHVAKLPGRVDVQQRKRRPGRIERFARQVQQHGGILADGVEQHRPAELRGSLTENVDALRFQQIEMRQRRGHATASARGRRGLLCRPHSLPSSCSHHQRPALTSSPGAIARVHGWQPIEGKPRACSGLTGNVVGRDVGFEALQRPVGQRVDLEQAVLVVPGGEGHLATARGLSAPQSGDPDGGTIERASKRANLAHVAAGLARFDGKTEAEHTVACHQLLDVVGIGRDDADAQAVALLAAVEGLQRLGKVPARVQSEDVDVGTPSGLWREGWLGPPAQGWWKTQPRPSPAPAMATTLASRLSSAARCRPNVAPAVSSMRL